ncbi:hypothetical protein AGOR_G00087440 [Albula goreensis]|uniref:Protein ELYS n=1 Tax=Albula goreensis TaxID=1534307 RepID=A0A8T3DKT3_9TELE|nr:hypothetical protein AGOR_G00087440 [Albula goreensis]
MCELAAQVTSSLLRFPDVTVDALGEDEITLDSVLHGKFTVGKSGLAWLACGPHLEVVQAVTGERFSAYCFSGVSEHPPNVLAARDFSWLKRTGLLVGLEEAEGSVLCLYDLAISRVVKAVVIPGRITAIEPLVSYGGASASTQQLHQSLRWFFGVVAVVTDVGHVLLVDLCLDDPSCSQSELEASDLEVVNKSPAEIPHIRERVTQQGRHLCLQLSSPTGTAATALQYVTRTNQLAVGFSDGYLQLWNMKTLKKEYHSQLEGGRVPVYAFTFQEPENDPRNCCYLWAVQSAQDHEGDVVSLHLLQLAFGERKCLASGKILYEGLEYCEERYSQDLSGTAFPLRAQATNTRLLGCQTIEKFRHHPDRDDSMNEGASPDTSVSIFSWQVKSYGQGRPSTYMGVFDINRWYHAQMPDSLRTGESLYTCPYLAVWSLDAVVDISARCPLLDVLVHERSLSRGLPYTWPPPEQFFSPTTYNFEATCLLNTGVIHVTCSGYQKETLSFLKRSAPSLSESIPDGYSRCLMSGLLSPRLADVQPSSLSQEEQLDAILSAAVETSSLGLITGCIKQWTAEEQPGSAVNLRYILEWAWNKVVVTKEELDGICAPLFDSSSNFTDPQTLQLLQHCQRLLGNLSTIFHCLLNEAHELTQKACDSAGVYTYRCDGLVHKNVVSTLISQYAQVVLWFCRTGLLPEGSDEDVLQISRPFYNYPVIKNYYTGRREELNRLSRGKWCSDCLMIDGLVGQFAERIGDLWRRDEGGTGQYPPPTLHALLDIYLLEDMEESAKQAIVIYLLLDVMYSLPNKSGASVESFPTAFAIPIGLVKLVQGLWLLDHHDHENSLELLLHPATSRSLWSWQHGRVLQALMCQGQHAVALRYLHTMRPPMSSTTQIKLCLSVLLHNRCMVEAWALLRQHSNKQNMEELLSFLYETCQELGLMKELLKLPLRLAEQECLERFLQGNGGLQNRELLMVHYLQQANYVPALQLNQTLKMNLNDRDPKHKERSNTRNSILDQYGKVLPRVQRKLATERAKPYQHPSTVHREVSRPQPLSTVAKRSAAETVLTRAAFISNVLTKIGEVWEGKERRPEASPLRSPQTSALPSTSSQRSPADMPEAFVGTPITMTSKRMSRILDLIVRPSASAAPEGLGLLQTPPSPAAAGPASTKKPSALRGIVKAPELSLLQTPQVVKRARALAATGPVFPGFTPQSILRSSLRPTPVGSPSASPARSLTPPPRPKESRITFIEETASPDTAKGPVPWSNGITAESEISLLTRGSPLPKPAAESWITQPPEEDEEEEVVTFVPPANEREEELSGVSESCSSSAREATEAVAVTEVSHTSVQSVDTTVEYHDAPAPEDLEEEQLEQQLQEEEEEEVIVNVKPVAPVYMGREEQEEPPAEEPEAEPSVEQEEAEASLEQKEVETAMEQEEAEPALEQEVDKPNLGQEVENHENEDAEQIPKQEEVELILEHEDSQPIEEQEEVAQSPKQEEAEQELEQEEAEESLAQEEADPSLEQQEAEQNLQQEEVENRTEQEEVAQPSERIDLDDFVERHLFGDDLSPPLTRSSIREASQTWNTTYNSEFSFDAREEEEPPPPPAAPAPPALTTQKSVTSVSSGGATTTDSHSVVSLNDSEDLSRASSEEEDSIGAEEEEEEDSESEVEIIEEVQGNGGQRRLPEAALFMQDSPVLTTYLDEQAAAAAVLSLVTSNMHEEALEEQEEREGVVMVDLEAEDAEDEDGNDGVRYTDLKPSDTLICPLDLDSAQQLVEAGCHTETDAPAGFTLMLETEELENGLAQPLENSNSHGPLLIMQLPQGTDGKVDGQEVICFDACEGLTSLPVQPQSLASAQTSGELITADQEDRESVPGVFLGNQELDNCDGTQMLEEQLIENEEPATSTKNSKPDTTETSKVIGKEGDPAPSAEAGAVCQGENAEPAQPVEVEGSEPVVKEAEPTSESELTNEVEEAEPVPAVDEAEPVPALEEAEPVPAVEEPEPVPAVEEAEPVPAVEEAEPVPAIEEEEPVPAIEEEEPVPAIEEEEPVPAIEEEEPVPAVEEAEPVPAIEEEEPVPVVDEAEPVPAIEEEEPVPAIEEAEPVPALEDAPLPVVEEAEPVTAIDEAEPVPLVNEVEPVPLVDEVEPVPALEEAEPVPAVNEAEPVPPLKDGETPSVDEEEPIPSAEAEPVLAVEEVEAVSAVEEVEPGPETESVSVVDVPQATTVKVTEETEPADTVEVVTRSKGRHTKDRKQEPPSEPRRMTRQRKTVTFPSPVKEAKSDSQSDEEKLQSESEVPSTPRRSTRSSRQAQDTKLPPTPRRTPRRAAEPKPQIEEEATPERPTTVESQPEPAKPQTPQKTPPRRGTRRTRNSQLTEDEAQGTEESSENELLASLPATRTRSTRKTRAAAEIADHEASLVLPEVKVEEAPPSPGRVTRKSSRGISLALESHQSPAKEPEPVTPKRSRRTMTTKDNMVAKSVETPTDGARRSTRSRLWNHLESSRKGEESEERLILDTPLEVEPGTEVADALMERLKDEGAKGLKGETTTTASDSGTTIIRARRRGIQAALEPAPSPLPSMIEELPQDTQGGSPEADAHSHAQPKATRTTRQTRASKASETDSSPPREYLSSPPQTRRKTRGRRAVSPAQSDTTETPAAVSAPVTRTRRAAASSSSNPVNEEENDLGVEITKEDNEAAKPRKKRTTRTKAAASSPPPPVKINLLSPMASPAELAHGVDRKEKAKAPLQRMSLRRKRLLDTIFPKPVTRRKML